MLSLIRGFVLEINLFSATNRNGRVTDMNLPWKASYH